MLYSIILVVEPISQITRLDNVCPTNVVVLFIEQSVIIPAVIELTLVLYSSESSISKDSGGRDGGAA